MESEELLPKPQTDLPLPDKDLPLPEKEIPAHSASQGQALRSYSWFFRNKIIIVFILVSFLIAFLIGGFVLGKNSANKPTPPGSPEPTAKAATPTPDPTVNWKTYAGTDFTIKYPANWITVDNEFITETTFVPGELDATKIYNIIEIQKYATQVYSNYTNKQWFEKLNKLNLNETYIDQRTIYTKTDSGKVNSGEGYIILKLDPSATFIGTPTHQARAYVLKDQTLYQFTLDLYDQDGLDTFEKMLPTFKFTDSEDGVACAQDAMQCPDGSWVGRSGPDCEFICPK